MTAYLTVILVLFILGLSGTAKRLQGQYPHQETYSFRQDIATLAIQISMLAWTINVLVGKA